MSQKEEGFGKETEQYDIQSESKANFGQVHLRKCKSQVFPSTGRKRINCQELARSLGDVYTPAVSNALMLLGSQTIKGKEKKKKKEMEGQV